MDDQEPKEVVVLRKQLATARTALEKLKRDWRPGRNVMYGDPYAIAKAAIAVIDEYERLK